mmetsp:Transcript_23040/g.58712  ORF Transcript_23040/g.58712 Transcript_23040/m.58712 type:complete len:208 (+) Transcript_23040:326-949(+)
MSTTHVGKAVRPMQPLRLRACRPPKHMPAAGGRSTSEVQSSRLRSRSAHLSAPRALISRRDVQPVRSTVVRLRRSKSLVGTSTRFASPLKMRNSSSWSSQTSDGSFVSPTDPCRSSLFRLRIFRSLPSASEVMLGGTARSKTSSATGSASRSSPLTKLSGRPRLRPARSIVRLGNGDSDKAASICVSVSPPSSMERVKAASANFPRT